MQSFVAKSKTCFNGFHRHLYYSYSTSTSSSTSSSTDLFANYLVDSLGFSHKLALSTSDKLIRWTRKTKKEKVNEFKIEANANSVVSFFKFHGFNDTHIRKIVSSDPRFLSVNAQKTLEPKIKMFKDEGFSGSDIVSIVSRNPQILLCGWESYILPAIQHLRQLLGCDARVIIAFLKKLHSMWAFGAIVKCLSPNVARLVSYGIPIELIRTHLIRQPTGFLRNPEKFKDMLVRIEQKIGIPRDSIMFLYGLHLAARSSENIESKCQMFKSFGWTDSDIKTFMMKNPCCFSLSKSNLKKKLEFLMNELQLKPAYLTSRTALFSLSLEKRIMPRYKVFLILKEKCLLEENASLYSAVCMSEPSFLERFVLPFEEVHEVYAKNTGCTVRMLTQERSDSLL